MAATSAFLPASAPSSSMHSIVISVESMSMARSFRSAKHRPSSIQAWSMRRAAHKAAIPSFFIASTRRKACGARLRTARGFARSESASRSPGASPGPCTTRFTPPSRSELLQDVRHRLDALLPGGELGLDAQLLRPGEAGLAALAADVVDHLGGVERRVLHEMQLHRLVRGVDARPAERLRDHAHAM